MEDVPDRGPDRASEVMADKVAEIKPKLRGWMHAGALPLVIVSFAVLIVLSLLR